VEVPKFLTPRHLEDASIPQVNNILEKVKKNAKAMIKFQIAQFRSGYGSRNLVEWRKSPGTPSSGADIIADVGPKKGLIE